MHVATGCFPEHARDRFAVRRGAPPGSDDLTGHPEQPSQGYNVRLPRRLMSQTAKSDRFTVERTPMEARFAASHWSAAAWPSSRISCRKAVVGPGGCRPSVPGTPPRPRACAAGLRAVGPGRQAPLGAGRPTSAGQRQATPARGEERRRRPARWSAREARPRWWAGRAAPPAWCARPGGRPVPRPRSAPAAADC